MVFGAVCSATQLEAFVEHVVDAAALMQQPRSRGTTWMDAEVRFVQELSGALADESGVPHLQRRRFDLRLVQMLTAAWRRLQRSGVLEARGILEEIRHRDTTREPNAFHAAIDAAKAAPGLRTCARCGAKEAHPHHFKSCAACRTVVYCCREHQVEGWPSHKKACKAACKAAAAVGGGAGPGAA